MRGIHKWLRRTLALSQPQAHLPRPAAGNSVFPIMQCGLADQPIKTSATPATVSNVPATIRAVIRTCRNMIAVSTTVTSG